jgi:fluoride ion exporter CrcB/FEX
LQSVLFDHNTIVLVALHVAHVIYGAGEAHWMLNIDQSPSSVHERQETNPHLYHQDELHENVNENMMQPSVSEDDTIENVPEETTSSPSSYYTTFWLLYAISICAFLGASTRASLAYYLQCDNSPAVSHQQSTACVTSSQSALFVDLPANLFGSFLMGVLLHQNHDTVPYCQAWQVGFCGSLTTCTYSRVLLFIHRITLILHFSGNSLVVEYANGDNVGRRRHCHGNSWLYSRNVWSLWQFRLGDSSFDPCKIERWQ